MFKCFTYVAKNNKNILFATTVSFRSTWKKCK